MAAERKQTPNNLQQSLGFKKKAAPDAQNKANQQPDTMTTVRDLAAAFAHDIATPLTVIQGTAECLMMEVSPDNHQYSELETILAQTKKITNMVDLLLTVSHYSSGEMRPQDVNGIILKVISAMDHQSNNHNRFVKTVLEPHLPSVSGDENQLIQAFSNIILTALQSMPEGELLTITTHKLSNDEKWVAILFSSKSWGASKRNTKWGFHTPPTTKSAGNCTGLGLTLSHRIVEDHNGIIEVESSLAKGGMLTIKLPYTDYGATSS